MVIIRRKRKIPTKIRCNKKTYVKFNTRTPDLLVLMGDEKFTYKKEEK